MKAPAPAASDPASVVQRQLDAYNARDVEALLEIYAVDAELFELPARLLAAGRDALRPRFVERFREPDLHAQLLYRTVQGSTVIDHERVTRNFPEGRGSLELVMIYEVESARIRRAWIIAGPKTLHAPA